MKSFKRQKTLDFYVKSGKTESTSSVTFSTSVCIEPSTASVVHDFCTCNSTQRINSPSTSEKPSTSTTISNEEDNVDYTNEYYDIGRYKGKSNITDFVKKQLLENPFCPPKNYVFPFSKHNKEGKVVKRYLN